MTHFFLCSVYWNVLKCVSNYGKTIKSKTYITETVFWHFWQANFYLDSSVWLYLLKENVYTPYVAMELTNNSSLKNFIGFSRNLRSMNRVWKGGGPDPGFSLLFHENPASRTFFIAIPNFVFSFPKIHEIRLISAKVGPFDWYFALAWLIRFCRHNVYLGRDDFPNSRQTGNKIPHSVPKFWQIPLPW